MKRFNEKPQEKTSSKKKKTPCMEEIAKSNIKNSVLNAAIAFGVPLNLQEQKLLPNDYEYAQKLEKTPHFVGPPDPLLPYLVDLRREEGHESSRYKDTKKVDTIGIGTNLTRPDIKQVFTGALGPVQGKQALDRANKGQNLTDHEINTLTRYDLQNTFLPRAKSLVKDFEYMPEPARKAIVSGTYTGMLVKSPKTRELINTGQIDQVGTEYKDATAYREDKAKQMKKGKEGEGKGVSGRMEREIVGFESLRGWKKNPADYIPIPGKIEPRK